MGLPDPVTKVSESPGRSQRPCPWGPLTLLISDSDLLEHILCNSLTRSASSSEPKESLWSKVNVSERSSSEGLLQRPEESFSK